MGESTNLPGLRHNAGLLGYINCMRYIEFSSGNMH